MKMNGGNKRKGQGASEPTKTKRKERKKNEEDKTPNHQSPIFLAVIVYVRARGTKKGERNTERKKGRKEKPADRTRGKAIISAPKDRSSIQRRSTRDPSFIYQYETKHCANDPLERASAASAKMEMRLPLGQDGDIG